MVKKGSVNALMRLMYDTPSQYELMHKARAQEVLNAWLTDNDETSIESGDEWERRVNAVIAKKMDVHSLHYLIKIVRVSREKAVRTALARKGADETHREHRAMKSEVFLWLDDNKPKFKSMDAAAEAITKQQPIAFRTARDWVGEWKKLRSASKQ